MPLLEQAATSLSSWMIFGNPNPLPCSSRHSPGKNNIHEHNANVIHKPIICARNSCPWHGTSPVEQCTINVLCLLKLTLGPGKDLKLKTDKFCSQTLRPTPPLQFVIVGVFGVWSMGLGFVSGSVGCQSCKLEKLLLWLSNLFHCVECF